MIEISVAKKKVYNQLDFFFLPVLIFWFLLRLFKNETGNAINQIKTDGYFNYQIMRNMVMNVIFIQDTRLVKLTQISPL